MFSFIISLLVLSLMFSIITAAAMLFRRTFLKGREGIMYPFWIVILIVSIIPIRINIAPITAAFVDEPSMQQPTPIVYTVQNDFKEKSAASDTPAVQTVSQPRDSKSTLLVKLERMKEAGIEFIGHIAFELCVFWLAGALLSFISAMVRFVGTKHVMLLNSSPCRDARILNIVSERRADMGIKRRVRLRIFDIESLSSPCVVGLMRPTLFVEPGCLSLSDSELKCVITHELTHLRRFDIVAKLICIFAVSVHWFNPTARHVMKIFNEDCEMSCDYSVIRSYGSEVSGIYMNAIVDFAERYARHCRIVCRNEVSSGLFASQSSSGVSFMKRRFTNMKNFRKKRFAIPVTIIFTLVCVLANILALSSCSAIKPAATVKVVELSPLVDAVIRAYCGLDEKAEITTDHIESIKSLKVIREDILYTPKDAAEKPEAYSLVKFTVNNNALFTSALPTLIYPNIYEQLSEDIYNGSLACKNTLELYYRFNAFYTFMDSSHPGYDNSVREQLNSMYPGINTDNSHYIFDPFATERETAYLNHILNEVGLLDIWELDGDEFDVSSFDCFANLEEIEFVGVTPVGYEFPDNVKVTLTNIPVEDTSVQ